MNQIFSQQAEFIQTVEKHHQNLDQHAINHILNQELFYHAQQELPNYIPNQHTPPTRHQLATKILKQLPGSMDNDQLLEQIQHRMKILQNDQEDQIVQLKKKWKEQEEKIRKSGARVKDYQSIYEEEVMHGITLNNSLSKKAVSYFEASIKDRSLDEMITDLIGSLTPELSTTC